MSYFCSAQEITKLKIIGSWRTIKGKYHICLPCFNHPGAIRLDGFFSCSSTAALTLLSFRKGNIPHEHDLRSIYTCGIVPRLQMHVCTRASKAGWLQTLLAKIQLRATAPCCGTCNIDGVFCYISNFKAVTHNV